MSDPKIRGLNHITFGVSNLDRSVAFYRDVLGCTLRAIWSEGAYLEAGTLWICLSIDTAVAGSRVRGDYTHWAFDVAEADFPALAARVGHEAVVWKDNRSEGASLYFLDPDGHKLELHVGSLSSRLDHYRAEAGAGVTVL